MYEGTCFCSMYRVDVVPNIPDSNPGYCALFQWYGTLSATTRFGDNALRNRLQIHWDRFLCQTSDSNSGYCTLLHW